MDEEKYMGDDTLNTSTMETKDKKVKMASL